MKRRKETTQQYGEGHKTHQKKQRSVRSVKVSQSEEIVYVHTILCLDTGLLYPRGPQLRAFFAEVNATHKFPKEDRFHYVEYPVFVWWNIPKKKPSQRFVLDLRTPREFLD